MVRPDELDLPASPDNSLLVVAGLLPVVVLLAFSAGLLGTELLSEKNQREVAALLETVRPEYRQN